LSGASNLRARAVAFYLPQYHRIPENDRWWGDGFTDWVNVRKASPLFPGHYQPRVPLGQRYYDLTDKDTIRWQIGLAQSYGVYGFCHYHYWFDGVQLLQNPTDAFLSDRSLDFPFCLAWANATWSRRWDGDENADSILMQQTHRPDRQIWRRHLDYLIRAWTDPRAITIEGKPVFLVYSPQIIVELHNLLEYWREGAQEAGLPGLHLVAMRQHKLLDDRILSDFDAVTHFQPAMAMLMPKRSDGLLSTVSVERHLRALPPWLKNPLKKVQRMLPEATRFYDYDELWKRALAPDPGASVRPAYPGAFLDWDNTARYGKRARIVRGADPKKFSRWFRELVGSLSESTPEQRLIFVNAWNEWAEGSYLEPDERNGYGYLEAIRDSVINGRG